MVFPMKQLIAFVLLMSLTTTDVSAAGKKYALVVGVEKYNPSQLTSLQYAEDDAVALGQALQKLGFDVVVMTRQADVPERVPAFADDILTQLKRRLRDRSPDDTIIVALSGHGVQLKGDKSRADGTKETYFCPERADLRQKSTLLAMTSVVDEMKACAAGRKLLLVDACRNEVEPQDIAGKDFSPVEIELDPAGVTRRTIPKGMVALFSCSSKERSFEISQLNHSVFTYHVLQYLNGKAASNPYPKQQISISELAAYVSRETRDYIDGRLSKDQNPELLLPGERLIDWSLGGIPLITNSIGMTLSLLPPGEFLMGSPNGETGRYDDELQHTVRITNPYYVAIHEVTVGQFRQFVTATNYKTEAETDGEGGWGYEKETGFSQDVKYSWRDTGFLQGDDHPVVNVSWNDAVAFCSWMTRTEGVEYRLPTEAEWEYACRAGTTAMYQHGNNPEGLAFVGNVADGSFSEQFGTKVITPISAKDGFVFTSPVGRFRSNAFGLFNMHGNAWEWCSDWYGNYKSSAGNDPQGPSGGSDRVLRGGGWGGTAGLCRSAGRSGLSPSYRDGNLGFRVARSSVK